jgi:hypothetical protein
VPVTTVNSNYTLLILDIVPAPRQHRSSILVLNRINWVLQHGNGGTLTTLTSGPRHSPQRVQEVVSGHCTHYLSSYRTSSVAYGLSFISSMLTDFSQIQGSSTNWGATVRQTVSVCPGQNYLFKGYGKAIGVVGNCQMWFVIGTTTMGTKFTASTAYTGMGDVFAVPAGVTSIALDAWVACGASGVANKVFFDDISLTLL